MLKFSFNKTPKKSFNDILFFIALCRYYLQNNQREKNNKRHQLFCTSVCVRVYA